MYVSLLTMKKDHEIYNTKYNLPNRGTKKMKMYGYIEVNTLARNIDTLDLVCMYLN